MNSPTPTVTNECYEGSFCEPLEIAFATLPFSGHFFPLVPIARALIRIGHRVSFLTSADFAETIKGAGFETIVIKSEGGTPIVTHNESGEPASGTLDSIAVEVLTGAGVEKSVPQMVEGLSQLHPDIVIRDCVEFSSYIGASVLGIPQIVIGTMAIRPLVFDASPLLGGLNRLRASAGLTMDADGSSCFLDHHLEFVPPSFYGTLQFGPRTRHLRQPKQEQEHEDVDKRLYEKFSSDLPTVLVSFGTVAFSIVAELRLASTLSQMNVNVIFESKGALQAVKRRLKRDNVFVSGSIVPAKLMSRCDLFVSHAGFNSTKDAMSWAVPMVLLPQFGDHHFIASRCRDIGLAELLPSDGGSRNGVAHALERVLTQPSYKQAAVAFSEEMAELPPLDNVLHEMTQ